MAEAIAAFGLASNILQVIDFGSKFVSIAWKIYRSSNAALDNAQDFVDIQRITKDLQIVLPILQDPEYHNDVAANDQNGIAELASDCSKVTQKLLDSLYGLLSEGRNRKWTSMKTAFKTLWMESEIVGLQNRLSEFRQQLTFHILVSLRLVGDYASSNYVLISLIGHMRQNR
jgi:hypothetical protein